jgi:hypothetical protein
MPPNVDHQSGVVTLTRMRDAGKTLCYLVPVDLETHFKSNY